MKKILWGQLSCMNAQKRSSSSLWLTMTIWCKSFKNASWFKKTLLLLIAMIGQSWMTLISKFSLKTNEIRNSSFLLTLWSYSRIRSSEETNFAQLSTESLRKFKVKSSKSLFESRWFQSWREIEILRLRKSSKRKNVLNVKEVGFASMKRKSRTLVELAKEKEDLMSLYSKT